MTEEEIKVLQEEAAGLRKEKEALAGNIAAREAEIAALQQNVAALKTQVGSVTETLNQAVAGYRMLAVKSNPEMPAELIAGETIEAVDKAMEFARGVIGKVREKLETEKSRLKVPPGAPLRTPPDTSALTPIEKIRQGITRK